MLPTPDNLNYLLESLRLVTLFSQPPAACDTASDPTPVTFTMAKGEPVSCSEEDSTLTDGSDKK